MEMDSSDTSARGQRPLCRLPRSQGPPSSLALKLHTHTHTHTHIYIYIHIFCCFWWWFGELCWLACSFFGAWTWCRFFFSWSPSPPEWACDGDLAGRLSGGAAPDGPWPSDALTQELGQSSGGGRDRVGRIKARSMRRKTEAAQSPHGLPVRDKGKYNYFKIQILYIFHTYLHMIHNLKYVLVGFQTNSEWCVRAENLLKRWKNWKRIKHWATSRSLKVFGHDTDTCLRNTNWNFKRQTHTILILKMFNKKYIFGTHMFTRL